MAERILNTPRLFTQLNRDTGKHFSESAFNTAMALQ